MCELVNAGNEPADLPVNTETHEQLEKSGKFADVAIIIITIVSF